MKDFQPSQTIFIHLPQVWRSPHRPLLPIAASLLYNRINQGLLSHSPHCLEVMMTVQRHAHFPLETLRPLLTSDGWDVSLRDALTATYEDGDGDFRLVVDRGGRVYLRQTRLSMKPRGEVILRSGRTYARHTEALAINSIATTLAAPDEFSDALSEMLSFLRGNND